MKKTTPFASLLLMIAILTLHLTTFAQFQPASLIDTFGPARSFSINASSINTSAHSISNIPTTPSGTCDIYVYSWDGGENLSGNAGFAVMQYPSGIPVLSGNNPSFFETAPLSFPIDDAASIDAAILKDGTDIYIALVYYKLSTQEFMYDIYEWDIANTPALSLITSTVLANGPVAFDWIHIDAINLQQLVVTFATAQIVTVMAADLSLTGTTIQPLCKIQDVLRVGNKSADVALSRINDGVNPPFTQVYVSCLDLTDQNLIVYGLDFNNIYSPIPPFPVTLVPAMLENMTGAQWSHPRIDAPDNHTSTDWAYVAADLDNINGFETIFSGVNSGAGLSHYRLNDGSLGSLTDITNKTFYHNRRPVLAYDKDPHMINYAWHYQSTTLPPASYSDKAYIGYKMDNTGSLYGPSTDYWILPYSPDSTSPDYSVALSANNDADEMFAVFTSYDPVNLEYYMSHKSVPWTNTSFRPGNATGLAAFTKGDANRVYPNPFRKNFQISGNSDKSYELQITDLAGRQVLKSVGDLRKINFDLTSLSDRLQPGCYLIELTEKATSVKEVFKIVKSYN